MPWVGFESTIPGFEGAKAVHALNLAATGIVSREIATNKLNQRVDQGFYRRILNSTWSHYHVFVSIITYCVWSEVHMVLDTRLFCLNERGLMIPHIRPFKVFSLLPSTFQNCESNKHGNPARQDSRLVMVGIFHSAFVAHIFFPLTFFLIRYILPPNPTFSFSFYRIISFSFLCYAPSHACRRN
jgi:hypothetical protein